jgi:hypothetical protein
VRLTSVTGLHKGQAGKAYLHRLGWLSSCVMGVPTPASSVRWLLWVSWRRVLLAPCGTVAGHTVAFSCMCVLI